MPEAKEKAAKKAPAKKAAAPKPVEVAPQDPGSEPIEVSAAEPEKVINIGGKQYTETPDGGRRLLK